MKQDFKKIIGCTVGALSHEIKDGKLYFNKCSKKQVDVWYGENQILGERAETTTGVRLDFHTTSKNFFAKVAPFRFELLINGRLCAQTEDGSISASLSGNDRVTLVFPCHNRGYIEYIELDDGADMVAHTYSMKMLFLGDSITQGYNSGIDCLCYSQKVTDHFNAESVINGIGGSYFLEAAFDKIDFDPDVVVVAYGCNDLGHFKSRDERFGHAKGFLSLTRDTYRDKKLFYIVPIPRRDLIPEDKAEKAAEFKASREGFERIARELGFNIIDGYEAVPPLEALYADGVHPNGFGFSLYAEHVIKKIQEKL